MDPISYLFSAYLNLVQQQVTDIYGTELKTLVVPYEGEQVVNSDNKCNAHGA